MKKVKSILHKVIAICMYPFFMTLFPNIIIEDYVMYTDNLPIEKRPSFFKWYLEDIEKIITNGH